MNKEFREEFLTHIIFVAFGLSGAAALIYEVVWTRSLSTIMGSSTYAVSTMLAAFMTGLSMGGWIGAVLTPKIKKLAIAFAFCELGIGIAGLAIIPAITAVSPIYIKSFYTFHLSFNTFSLVQFCIIFMIMGIPTTLMGLTFPFVIKLASRQGTDIGTQAGNLYGINTLGAIIGSVSAGFLLIPALGIKGTAITAASINIFTSLIILLLSGDLKRVFMAALLLLTATPMPILSQKSYFPFFSYYNAFRFGDSDMANMVRDIVENSADSKILYHKEGIEGSVSLIRYKIHNSGQEVVLVNNGKMEAGDEKGFALLAYLPYFLHPGMNRPETALNIGLGSGHTLARLVKFPLSHIDSVELSEGIIEVNRKILRPDLFTDPRIDHIQADGRNYLLVTGRKYDIIIASPSWAVEISSAGLLTDEFFQIAENGLNSSGIFSIWIDFFMMTHNELEMVARTFSKHFNHALAWYVEGDFIIFVGANSPFQHSPEQIMELLIRYYPNLKDKFSLALSEAAFKNLPEGRLNTDDRPFIEFRNAKNLITWRSGD